MYRVVRDPVSPWRGHGVSGGGIVSRCLVMNRLVCLMYTLFSLFVCLIVALFVVRTVSHLVIQVQLIRIYRNARDYRMEWL